jgi:hypothetical protein
MLTLTPLRVFQQLNKQEKVCQFTLFGTNGGQFLKRTAYTSG